MIQNWIYSKSWIFFKKEFVLLISIKAISEFQVKVKVIYTKYSKQFKWNSYFYVSGQNRPFWAALELLKNSDMKFK